MGKNFKTSIGGQAVMEGVMMRGPRKSAMAVRKPDKSVYLEEWDNKPPKKISKVPFIRGSFNFVYSMIDGYKCLMKSAEISTEGLEEETESKFEKWLEEKCGEWLMKIIMVIASVLGVAISVVLFMYLPTVLVTAVKGFLPPWSFSLVEGIIKILIFIGYLSLVSLIPDMKRLFQYHGAEHKTIFCYEAGEELTVENVRKQKRFHPRCGTSFIFISLALSILVFSVVTWSNPLVRTLLKIALLPVVVGIAYELIKLAGKYDNLFTRIISFPGLQIQKITTKEPDDDQIEIAIASMKPVLPEVEGEDKW